MDVSLLLSVLDSQNLENSPRNPENLSVNSNCCKAMRIEAFFEGMKLA
jgi:hypothetical protein